MTIANDRPRTSAGTSSNGGKWMTATQVVSSSGSDGNRSVQARSTSAVRSAGKKSAPAASSATGTTSNSIAVTMPKLPDELTTWVAVIHFPPFDEVPAEVRGRSFAIVMAAFLGPESAARDLLAPVIDLGPELDALATQSPSALGTLAMDPEQPLPYRTVSAVLDRLPPETIDEVARIAADASALTLVQFRHAGGALSRVDAEAGSLAALPGDVVMFGLGLVAGPGAEATVRARLAELASAVAPAFAGDYANLVEEPADASAFFDAATWDRLERVKADWDPDDVVVGTHHVPARARA